MNSLFVFFLAVLLIQAATGSHPEDDNDEYEEHHEHSYVISSSSNPGQVHTQTFVGRPPTFFPPMNMNFGFDNPARQNFGGVFGPGKFGGFPSFGPMPGFPPLGQMGRPGSFGLAAPSFQMQYPGGFGQMSEFSGPGSAAFASSGTPGGSHSQLVINPGVGSAFASSTSSHPESNKVSISSVSSSSTDGQTSGKGVEESEPSIAVEF